VIGIGDPADQTMILLRDAQIWDGKRSLALGLGFQGRMFPFLRSTAQALWRTRVPLAPVTVVKSPTT
jgi:hypothetical protein